MRFTVYKRLFIYLLGFLFSFICLADNIESLEKNDAVFIANEKANQGLFNPVEYSSFKLYKGEGGFVEAPARVGDWTGYIIGVLPAAVITEPFRLIPIAGYEGNNIGEYTLYGTTKTFGCLFGGFPFIFKSAFYDFPVWVFSSGNNKSVDKSLAASKEEQEKIFKEIQNIENKKWDMDTEPKIQIRAISIKSNMLKINEEALIAKGFIPDTTKESKKQTSNASVKTKPNSLQELFESKVSSGQEMSTEKKPQWDSSPELPDWVKEEINK